MSASSRSFPVVRLEVESMKHSILHAFTQHTATLDADVQKAVEQFCTPENITRILAAATDAAIREAIEAEVHSFFRYGDGRGVIRDAVKERLERDYLAARSMQP